jgi:uncharacterized protein (DUF1330 family)
MWEGQSFNILSFILSLSNTNKRIMDYFNNAEKEVFLEFLQAEISGPFHMLNLIKFKDLVTETGLTGNEQYEKYMAAATPFLKTSGAKLTFIGSTKHCLIGPRIKEWDKVLLVEYPSKAAFVDMVTDPDYPADLRTMALEDSRLILCQ